MYNTFICAQNSWFQLMAIHGVCKKILSHLHPIRLYAKKFCLICSPLGCMQKDLLFFVPR